ncbi:MAG TPA: phosphopantetheine-binding protein [Rhizomicrobium sp.]|jgi:acyl carrier protein
MTVSPQHVRAVLLGIPSWARTLPNIADNTPFSECDIDSLALLELVSEVQRVYGIEIPDDDVESVSSIADTARYLSQRAQ